MKAPAFSLLNPVSNERISLEDYKGKPLLLTFWASWCLIRKSTSTKKRKSNSRWKKRVYTCCLLM
ncbi:redoxin domain-containing protein [Geomicrobium sp. JCM 19037]|uniref:peroxiredoxin family protein n=1 Tax=Geomicrobium sp. JCM 19037 TaxID=1460634 RepID=UPI00187C70C7